jgi:hypothetical protein
MKNRKILLLALLSIALVFNLIPPAWVAEASATVPRPDDNSIIHSTMDSSNALSAMVLSTPTGKVTPMVAAGFGDRLVEFNPVLGASPSQCVLNISSTAGGSVTTPGEGVFTYDVGTVVNLVAEPQEGHRFVRWTGDVWMMGDVNTASTTVTMRGDYSITANFAIAQASDMGVKAGEWIKFEYRVSGGLAGQSYPEWLKLEFLSVEGTSAVIRVTMPMPDGTEQSGNVTVDLAASGGEASGLSGFVIPANLTAGDSVYITGYGNMPIAGETTRTCVGASRTVVYASLSQNETYLTYYWDKSTGIMVEASATGGNMTMTAKAIETNMWEAAPPAVGMPWWVWVIIAVAIGAVAFAVYRLKKRKTPTTPPPPTEGT